MNDSLCGEGGEDEPHEVGIVVTSVSDVRDVLADMKEYRELLRICSRGT